MSNMLALKNRMAEVTVYACSWCNKIRLGEGPWQEFDEALPGRSIGDIQAMPQVSHGICRVCYDRVALDFSN